MVGQIAATFGLTVLDQAGMALWDHLKALGLVEYGDELIGKKVLPPDWLQSGITQGI